ncbi:MAG: hypothetical protein WCO48_02215 [Candidatus Taylorbacteria bacterium]
MNSSSEENVRGWQPLVNHHRIAYWKALERLLGIGVLIAFALWLIAAVVLSVWNLFY